MFDNLAHLFKSKLSLQKKKKKGGGEKGLNNK